jgi:L-lactate dehydrogenase (cytochrome)
VRVTARRRPRWSELRPLVGVRAPSIWNVEERMARVPSIADMRLLARRRAPRSVFDYTDGGAGNEVSLRRARDAFARVEFVPQVLRDVSDVDPSTTLLGARAELPLVFAPTGFTRLMGTPGEAAVARVARDAGIPHTLSTMGTTSIERIADEVPGARRWFQLYVWRDRGVSRDLVQRAQMAGCEALLLTVDTAVAGDRLRDVRNGFTIPPALTLRTLADMALHPAWWFDMLTTEPLTFANFSGTSGSPSHLAGLLFDPAVTLEDLSWLRESWDGPLIVKGVMTAEDAQLVAERGADGVVLSNHGGRQLDRAPTPLEQLPRVVDQLGDRAEVYLDGGILGGADVVAAVAMGARGCLVARAYLYGLMAGGEAGVRRVAHLFREEIVRTLQLLGVTAISELSPERARLRSAA